MKLKFLLLFSLLLILTIFSQLSQSTSVNSGEDVVLGFIHDVNEIATTVRLDIEQLHKDTGEFDNAKIRDNQLKVLEHFKNISTLVHHIEKKHLAELISNEVRVFDLIDRDYKEMFEKLNEEFTKMEMLENTENDSLISFSEGIYQFNSKRLKYDDFYWDLFYVPQLKYKFLSQLRDSIEVPLFKFCGIPRSTQQLIYNLYKDIALPELKGYILNEFALLIRRVSGQENSSTEIIDIRNNYSNITENTYNSLIKAKRLANGRIWNCDPENHEYKVTYDEVTRLIQGYVENEAYLNSDGTCSQTCDDYRNTTRTGCSEDELCAKQPQCSGRIYNCQFIESDMSVCQSATSSNRRYEYIEYDNGRRLGEHKDCWRNINNVESWHRWIIHKCSYCFCLCDEPGPLSDRYFNLRETLSDVRANKVMSGIRFVKKNRVFHLQIQQGKLLPRGMIDEATLEWGSVDDYNINDPNVVDGRDYHTLTYHSRSMDLTEVRKLDDPSLIVTGVRFGMWLGALNLEVHFSKFDFVKGELVEPKMNCIWESKMNATKHKVNLANLDLPTRSMKYRNETIVIKDGQYVEFENSGVNQDAAQSTVPFIDIRDVVSLPALPLAGVGIAYKAQKGYGGFVTPEIIDYDILPYIPVPKITSK